MPTERRLAAIMFTDIVGSTAVTARSESAGLALRDRHRDLVRAFPCTPMRAIAAARRSLSAMSAV
jgi:class 3 adenylate cyclase